LLNTSGHLPFNAHGVKCPVRHRDQNYGHTIKDSLLDAAYYLDLYLSGDIVEIIDDQW